MEWREIAAWLAHRLAAWLFALFLIFSVVGGGSSRPDNQGQPLIWLLSVLCCAAALWFRPISDFRPVRSALMFAALMVAVMAIQLIPLAPSLWSTLPGHALYADAAAAVKLPRDWHPISLTPDLTWASLLALLPIFATVIGFHCLSAKDRKLILPLLLIAAMASALLGMVQISAGPSSALRYYPVTNEASAVGFFANRNHNALFLVLGLPMLTVWARLDPGSDRLAQIHYWVALGCGLFLLPMILATGSRAGVVLGVVGLAGAVLLARSGSVRPTARHLAGRWLRIGRYLPIPLGVMIVAGTILMARASALDRLFVSNIAEEQRGQMITPLWNMLISFFPFGSGFGSFDPVYRAFEPVALLNTAYMNHAHNDLLHIIIEGGAPALLLLVAYLIWWVSRVRVHWAGKKRLSANQLMGQLGSVMTFLMLVASLFDYPLRMPFLGIVFMIATLWMMVPPHPVQPQRLLSHGTQS